MSQQPNRSHQNPSTSNKSPAQTTPKSSVAPVNSDIHRRGSAWSITNMPKEIAFYAIDRPVHHDVKAQDIQIHQDDENKDEFQRALLLLKGDETEQKAFAAQNFAMLISKDAARTFKEILPAIELELKNPNTDPEFHSATALNVTRAIIELLPKNQQQARQLITLSAVMCSNADTSVCDAWWMHGMEPLVEQLNNENIQREILPHLIQRFGKEQASLNSKRIAARLIGKLSKKLPEEVVSKQLLPVVQLLCSDKESTVRGSMCIRLPEVVAKSKDKDKLIPVLNTMLNDTDHHVMVAVVGAVSKAATLMSPKDPNATSFLKTVVPILKKFVKKAFDNESNDLLLEYTPHMGHLTFIIGASGVLNEGDKLWFLDAYLQLSKYGLAAQFHGQQTMPTGFSNYRSTIDMNKFAGLEQSLLSEKSRKSSKPATDATAAANALALLKSGPKRTSNSGSNMAPEDDRSRCRLNAAAGFASFIKFAKPLVEFRNGLHPMIVDLVHDPIPSVRAKMAESLYSIMCSLSIGEAAALHGEFVYALSDDKSEVIEAFVPHLADMFKIFVQAKLIAPDAVTSASVEIGGALLFSEERLSQSIDWRVHATMLEQLAVLPFGLPGDYIYQNFIPSLFARLLHMRQMPCRIAAADAICAFLRHCRRANQREEIRRKIIEGFAHGRSVHDRMLFLFMSKKIMELFSRKYYRDHFFETTLAMADDSVANIRLKTVYMMPDLKGVLQMSDDPTLLNKLNDALTKIKNSENDRDVQNAIDAVIPEMEKIGVVFKSDAKGPKTEADLADEAKEREESYIASLEPPSAKETPPPKRVSVPKAPKVQPPPPSKVVPQAPPPPVPIPPVEPKKSLPPTPPPLAPTSSKQQTLVRRK